MKVHTSTPVVYSPKHNSLRRSVLLKDLSVVVTPLRRLSNIINHTPVSNVVVDDDLERSSRRTEADIQRRVSNISANQSPLPTNEKEIRDHFQICLKMYAENKISVKNAWNLKIIDYMRAVLSSKGQAKDSLQVAGTSLDVSTKIYGIRVDDIHSDGLKLANNMARVNPDKDAGDDDDNDGEGVDDDTEKQGAKKRKRPKRLLTGPKMTIAKDPKSLLSDITKMESVFFQTRMDLEASSTDNLFTNKLPMHPSGHKFMLLSKEKAWISSDNTENFDDLSKSYPMEIAKLNKFQICAQFSNFEIDEWDPDNENELLNYDRTVTEEVVYDADGIPIPELDGSVHDLFANADAENNYCSSEEEELNGIGHIAIQNKQITHIIDFQPDDDNEACPDDYSYSGAIKVMGNKRITQVWAGPSHWKLKHIRPSLSRFSGQPEKQVAKSVKKPKVQPTLIDFSCESNLLKNKLYKSKRRCPDESAYKCTLPQVLTSLANTSFMLKPFNFIHNNNFTKKVQENVIDNEVPPYNYENPNDSQYCSQNGMADDDNGADDDEEMLPEMHQNFNTDNLVGAPELVPKTYIPYALQAKKMDMKKLKAATWKCLVSKTPSEIIPDDDMYKRKLQETTFKTVFTHLPDRLNEKMRQELSCPLAFVALLHLANEQNLSLEGHSNLEDFTITQQTQFVR